MRVESFGKRVHVQLKHVGTSHAADGLVEVGIPLVHGRYNGTVFAVAEFEFKSLVLQNLAPQLVLFLHRFGPGGFFPICIEGLISRENERLFQLFFDEPGPLLVAPAEHVVHVIRGRQIAVDQRVVDLVAVFLESRHVRCQQVRFVVVDFFQVVVPHHRRERVVQPYFTVVVSRQQFSHQRFHFLLRNRRFQIADLGRCGCRAQRPVAGGTTRRRIRLKTQQQHGQEGYKVFLHFTCRLRL